MKIVLLTLFPWSLVAVNQFIRPESIMKSKQETSVTNIQGRIPLVYRTLSESELMSVKIFSKYGLKDAKSREALTLFADSLLYSSKQYSKEKVNELAERHSMELGCQAGMELFQCTLGVDNEDWQKGLGLLLNLAQEPLFEEQEIKKNIERNVGSLKSQMADPENGGSEAVNSVFYPKNHPYYKNLESQIAGMSKVSRSEITALWNDVFNLENLGFVVVGSIPQAEVQEFIEKNLKPLAEKSAPKLAVSPPVFDPKSSYAFKARDTQAAYMEIKFNLEGRSSEMRIANRLLTRMLSEELWDEVRAKRSLCYSVYASRIEYEIGIGVIGASTSRPNETLEAIKETVEKFKAFKYSADEIEEQKTIYTTAYFLGQETNHRIGDGLMDALFTYGDPKISYDMPSMLASLKVEDLRKQAQKVFKNFRVGISGAEKSVNKGIVESFIKTFAAQ